MKVKGKLATYLNAIYLILVLAGGVLVLTDKQSYLDGVSMADLFREGRLHSQIMIGYSMIVIPTTIAFIFHK
jgi:hypothetical protein